MFIAVPAIRRWGAEWESSPRTNRSRRAGSRKGGCWRTTGCSPCEIALSENESGFVSK